MRAPGGGCTCTRIDRQSLRLPSTILLRPRWSGITVRRHSAGSFGTVRSAAFPCPAGRVAGRPPGGTVQRLPMLQNRLPMRGRTPW